MTTLVLVSTDERPRMSRMARTTALLLGILVLALSGCGDTGAEPTATSGVEVPTTPSGSDTEAAITIQGFAFSGATSVPAGTTVVATNHDGVAHTWTSTDEVWNSGSLGNGDSFEFTFSEPGEYDYFCSIHPQMTGTLTVEG